MSGRWRSASAPKVPAPRWPLPLAASVAALMLVSSAVASARQLRTGVLRVESDQQRDEINSGLSRALAARGQIQVVGPLELQARLSRDAKVTAAVALAKAQLERAEHAAFQMNRAAAVEASSSAIDLLRGVQGRFSAHQLLLRAQVALSLGLLLKPAEERAAEQAFRAALSLKPALQADALDLPPPAAKVFARAAASPPQISAPTARQLEWLAERAQLDQIVWIGLTTKEKPRATLVLYERSEKRIKRRVQTKISPGAELTGQIAPLVAETLGARPAGPGGGGLLATTQPASAPAPRDVQESPWYKSWWFWTLTSAAAVAVGLGVGLGVGLNSDGGAPQPPPNGHFDFYFDL